MENTINGQYYPSNLKLLKEAINLKRRGKLRVGVPLLQANAPVLIIHFAVAETANRHLEMLLHPPYTPELTSSDFFIPKLKRVFLAV